MSNTYKTCYFWVELKEDLKSYVGIPIFCLRNLLFVCINEFVSKALIFTGIYGVAWAVVVADNKELEPVAVENCPVENCPLVFERIAYFVEAAAIAVE